MATLVPIKFGDQAFMFGNGADPEVFSEPCGIVGIGRNWNINTQSDDLPDCEDKDAIGFDSPYKVSAGLSVDLQLVLTPELEVLLEDLVWESEPTNARHAINKGTRTGYYAGPGIMTARGDSAERRGNTTGNVTWTWTSKPVWVPAP